MGLIRLPEVLRRTGESKSSLYRKIKAGLFPKPVRLGPPPCRAVGWPDNEVDAYVAAVIAAARRPDAPRIASPKERARLRDERARAEAERTSPKRRSAVHAASGDVRAAREARQKARAQRQALAAQRQAAAEPERTSPKRKRGRPRKHPAAPATTDTP